MAMQPEPVPASKIADFLFNDTANTHSTSNSVSGLGIHALESK